MRPHKLVAGHGTSGSCGDAGLDIVAESEGDDGSGSLATPHQAKTDHAHSK
jgi:hypothetical protein